MKKFGTSPSAARYSPIDIKKKRSAKGAVTGGISGAISGAAAGTPGGPPGQIIGGTIGAITGAISGSKTGPNLDQAKEAASGIASLKEAAAAKRLEKLKNAPGTKTKKR